VGVHSPVIWLRYALLLLIVPAYLIALKRGRWTIFPLWLVSASAMLVQFELSVQQNAMFTGGTAASSFLWIAETAKIMLIPVSVQFAVILKAWEARTENRAENGSRQLVPTFNTGEL
jgi:hypothetical protein